MLTVYVRIGRRMCMFDAESTGAPLVYTSHHPERHGYVVHLHTKVLRLRLSDSMSSSEQSSNGQTHYPSARLSSIFNKVCSTLRESVKDCLRMC